jgi:hypothetical protein
LIGLACSEIVKLWQVLKKEWLFVVMWLSEFNSPKGVSFKAGQPEAFPAPPNKEKPGPPPPANIQGLISGAEVGII